MPKPPEMFVAFTAEFPALAAAWSQIREAGEVGPLDELAQRLLKLAVAVGAGRDGAVSSAVRKALAAGATPAMMDQVLTLAASTVGFPAVVAAYSIVRREQVKADARKADSSSPEPH